MQISGTAHIAYAVPDSSHQPVVVGVAAGVMVTLPQPGHTEVLGTTILVMLNSCAIWLLMHPMVALFAAL